MKKDHTYHGFRNVRGVAHVNVDGRALRLMSPAHSPTGFEWGYGGSGPAELSRQMLRHHFGTWTHSSVYQPFKREIISNLPSKEWVLTTNDINEWLQSGKKLDKYEREAYAASYPESLVPVPESVYLADHWLKMRDDEAQQALEEAGVDILDLID